jgi:pyridinium-3,5-biscarboxylic acid mononucleotide synthase
MNREELKKLLESVQNNQTDVADALEKLSELPQKELGYATLDSQRELRVGYPEVIYCAGKTVEQVQGIVKSMLDSGSDILGTRATEEMYRAVLEVCPDAQYNKLGRTITVQRNEKKYPDGVIAIVCAGTSDLPVVEEAYETARILGNHVEKIVDVGVAGIHRLFSKLERIRNARVVIVVAGMEGALASVVAGLVDKPVIAVPTSVGYGASFGGIAALLTMLNSCASGITVVNIDNGFGAAYAASLMNKV